MDPLVKTGLYVPGCVNCRYILINFSRVMVSIIFDVQICAGRSDGDIFLVRRSGTV